MILPANAIYFYYQIFINVENDFTACAGFK